MTKTLLEGVVDRCVNLEDRSGVMSDLLLLSTQSDVVQKRALEIYFDGAAELTMAQVIEMARADCQDAEIEKIYREFERDWKHLPYDQKRDFVALHGVEILALMGEIVAVKATEAV